MEVTLDCVNRLEELAWAAGFFDGEGSTGTYDRRFKGGRLNVNLSVPQNDLDILKRFQEAIGGVGRTYGPYFRKSKPGSYVFQTKSFESIQFILAQLWPWLTPEKKNQGAKALVTYRTLWFPRPEVQHGTLSRYCNQKCRCDLCLGVGREYYRNWMRNKRLSGKAAKAQIR